MGTLDTGGGNRWWGTTRLFKYGYGAITVTSDIFFKPQSGASFRFLVGRLVHIRCCHCTVLRISLLTQSSKIIHIVCTGIRWGDKLYRHNYSISLSITLVDYSVLYCRIFNGYRDFFTFKILTEHENRIWTTKPHQYRDLLSFHRTFL